tara:strand:+ start:1100 stop:1318 length:219 start_codon:yes stop_codon:yes gene_type:complete
MSFSQNYTINSRGFQNKLNEVDRLFTKGDITSGNKLHAWLRNKSNFHYKTVNIEVAKIRLKHNIDLFGQSTL